MLVYNMGLAYADYDKDGWIDFVVGNWNRGYRLYRNQGIEGGDNHWLTVKLTGDGPVNREAVGARVYLTDSDGRVQMQEVKSGSSLGAGNETALHFGLGRATVDIIKVVWPNERVRYLKNIGPDRLSK